MLGLAGVATMITYSQKAGRSAQGLSEAGLLTDSIRSILSDNTRCTNAFRVAPSGGGTPVAPVLTSMSGSGSSVQLTSIGTSSGTTFTPYATAGQKFGSITITGMTLTRTDASSMTLNITASRGAGAVGGTTLEIPQLILGASFDSTTGAITWCSFAGGGAGSPANHGTITLLTSSSPSPWTVPSTVTSVKVTLIGGGGAGGGACCGLGGLEGEQGPSCSPI